MQTIHYAATNGCVELLTSLIEHSGVNPQEREAEVCMLINITLLHAIMNEVYIVCWGLCCT